MLKSPELVPVPKQTPRKRKYLDEVIPEGTVVSVSPIPTDEERLMLIADEDNEELKGVTLAVPLRDALDFDAEELSYHGEVLARDAFNDLDLKETGQVNVATQRPSSSSNPRIARAHSKIDQLENAITELTAELNAMRMNLTDIEVEETQIAETEETILKEFNTNQYARVAIQKLPLRIAPGDRQSVVTNLPKGTRVRVISKSNSWTRVESDEGLTAWVPSYALQFAK